jgi:hypothetical protein
MCGMKPRISTIALWRSLRRMLSLLVLLALIAFGTGAAIVVQAGRNDDQAGSAMRLDTARRLYIEGKISRILLAGPEANASRSTLQSRGVKEDAVIELAGERQSEQLAAARQALEGERLTRALLIAEPVEMLRLLKIAHDQQLRPLSTPVGSGGEISISGASREIGRYFRYVLFNS